MQVQVREEPSWRRVVDVTIPSLELEPEMERAYKSYQRNVKIQGFRKGKAPMQMIKRMYGSKIEYEVIEKLLPKIVSEASEQEKLEVISTPRIENLNYNPGGDLSVTFSVDVKPEFELSNYEGFKLEKHLYQVTEEDVAEFLESLRRDQAVWQTEDEEIKEEHFALIDLQEVDAAGLPIIGQKYEDQMIAIKPDDNNEISEIGEQILGAKVGEKRTIQLTLPQSDAPDAPKEARKFEVTVKEVRKRILPELDDEFAKDLGDYDSLEALKEVLREKIKQDMQRKFDDALHRQLIDEVIKSNPIAIPESMVEQYLDAFVEQMRNSANNEPIDEDAIRAEYRPSAIWNLKWQLIYRKLAEIHDIQVGEDELKMAVHAHAERLNTDPDRYWNRIKNDEDSLYRYRRDIMESKVLSFLVGKQKIKEKKVTRKDLEKRRIIEN